MFSLATLDMEHVDIVYIATSPLGPSIKYVTLFLANFDPLPCHTLSHIPGLTKVRHTSRTPPIFSRPGTETRTKAPCTNSLLIVRGGLCPEGFCQGAFCLEGFVGGFCPLPHLSEYICYNRKLNITLNFMFHMYDKKNYKCEVTCSLIPPLSQTVKTSPTSYPPILT